MSPTPRPTCRESSTPGRACTPVPRWSLWRSSHRRTPAGTSSACSPCTIATGRGLDKRSRPPHRWRSPPRPATRGVFPTNGRNWSARSSLCGIPGSIARVVRVNVGLSDCHVRDLDHDQFLPAWVAATVAIDRPVRSFPRSARLARTCGSTPFPQPRSPRTRVSGCCLAIAASAIVQASASLTIARKFSASFSNRIAQPTPMFQPSNGSAPHHVGSSPVRRLVEDGQPLLALAGRDHRLNPPRHKPRRNPS